MTLNVHVNHLGLMSLERDLRQAPRKLATGLRGVVREGVRVGNSVAKDNARASSGSHGRLYPRSFTADTVRSAGGFGAAQYSAEYGPDAAFPQGGMSFETGSRNQPPHLDLARSADLIGPSLPGEVRNALDKVFW